MSTGLAIGVVGASGAVGRTMLQVLEEGRYLPVGSLRLFGSDRSAGTTLPFRGEPLCIERADAPGAFDGLDVVLMSAGSGPSGDLAPRAAAAGALVVDNSSAWRAHPQVPLVVPEVNAEALGEVPLGIVANPNCSTIQLVVALAPLLELGPVRTVTVATYQAISGAGARALAAFEAQRRAVSRGEEPDAGDLGAVLVDDVLQHWRYDGTHQEEERKILRESRRILGRSDLRLLVTTARVPVARVHSEAVTVHYECAVDLGAAGKALRDASGLVLHETVPPTLTPRQVAGRDEVFVSRLRYGTDERPDTLSLWVMADNLRKGAATNAVQIAARQFGHVDDRPRDSLSPAAP